MRWEPEPENRFKSTRQGQRGLGFCMRRNLSGWIGPSQRISLDTHRRPLLQHQSLDYTTITTNPKSWVPKKKKTKLHPISLWCVSLEILSFQLKPTPFQSSLHSTSIYDTLLPERYPCIDAHITTSLTMEVPLYARLYSKQLRYSRGIGVASNLYYLNKKRRNMKNPKQYGQNTLYENMKN